MIERIMKGMPHLKKGIKLLVYTVKLYRQIKVVGTYKAPLFLQKPLISRMPLVMLTSVNSIDPLLDCPYCEVTSLVLKLFLTR